MKLEDIKDENIYYLVDKHYTVQKIHGNLLKMKNPNYNDVYDNIEDSTNRLLQNLEEYYLTEKDEENRDIALYNIEQLKQKILNPKNLAFFKLFKGQE